MVDGNGVVEFWLFATTSILIIMNPISTSAVFAALTEDMTVDGRRMVILTSLKISVLVLFFFALTGQVIFGIFGLTIPAFKIAGGILLISVATGMLSPKKVEYSTEQLENIAIVPLAFPLTCGAGTITTVILLVSEGVNVFQVASVFVAILIAIGVSYLGMTYAPSIFRIVGEQELRVIPKLMSIIVLAIAIQFLISGIAEAMPQLLAQVR